MPQEKLTIEDNKRVNALFKQMTENPNLVSEEVFESFSEIRRRINSQFAEEDTDIPFEAPQQSSILNPAPITGLQPPPILGVTPIDRKEPFLPPLEAIKDFAAKIEPAIAVLSIPSELLKRVILDIKKGEINFKETIVKPFILPFIKGSVFGEFTLNGKSIQNAGLPLREQPEDRITINVLEQIGIGEGPSIPAPDFMQKIGIERFTTRGLAEFGLEVFADVVAFGNIAKIFRKAKSVGIDGLDDAERLALRNFGKDFEELTGDELKEAAEKFRQVFGEDIEDITTDLVNLRKSNIPSQQDDIIDIISNKLFNNRKLLEPEKRVILNQEVKQISRPLVIDSNTRISSSQTGVGEVINFGDTTPIKLTFLEEKEIQFIRKLIEEPKQLPPPKLSSTLPKELTDKVEFKGFDDINPLEFNEVKNVANRVVNFFNLKSPRLLNRINKISFIWEGIWKSDIEFLTGAGSDVVPSLGFYMKKRKHLVLRLPLLSDSKKLAKRVSGGIKGEIRPALKEGLGNFLIRVFSHELGHAFDDRFSRLNQWSSFRQEKSAENFEIAVENIFERSGMIVQKPEKKIPFDINKETTYNGKQILDDEVAEVMGFKEADIYTDNITRSTFTVRSGESVETELLKLRKRFGIKPGERQVDFNSLFEGEKKLANELVAASSGFIGRDAAANIVRGIDVEENILKSVNSRIKDITEHNKTKDVVFDEITKAIQDKVGIKVDRKKLPYSIDSKSVDIDDVPLTKKGASIPDPYKVDNPGKTGFGSGNKVFTKARKDKALKGMTKDLNKLNSGLDPNDFARFVNIGGYYVEGGLRAFGPWSRKMVDELGKFIRPHLKKIWNELKSKHKKAFSATPGVSSQEKRINAKLNTLFEVPNEPFRDKLKRGFIMMQEMLDNRFVVVNEMEKVVEQTLNIKLPFDMRPSRMLQLASGRFGAAEPSLNVLLNIQRRIPKTLEKDFSKYMIAERVIELSGRGFQKVIKDLNLTVVDAQTILGQLKRNLSKDEFNIFKGLSDEYRRLLKEDGLDVLLQEGIISRQLYDNVIKLNKKYMPFHVLNKFADGNYLSRVFGSGTFNVKTQDIIQPITGAIKGIDPDPFRRGEKILYRIYDIISRNRVARMVGDLADSPGYETFITKPKKKTSSAPEGFKEIFWLEKGVKQRVFVDSDIHRVLMLLQEDQFSRAQRILAKMAGASVLRLGATGANLGFAFRNVLRDPQNAAILARHGLSGHAYTRAIAESFNRGDLWDLWARSGGRFATAASQLERNFIDLGKVSKSDFNKGMLNTISITGEQVLRVIDNSETITRLNIFQTDLEVQLGRAGFKDLMQALKGKRGKFFDLPKDMQMAIYNASWESRDYIDFARSGSFLKHVNMFAPYLNADAQGKSKMIRFALDDPEKFFKRLFIGSLAVTSVYAWNSMFESFKRVPPWMRDNSIVFMYGQYTDTGNELHPLYFRIPKGDVLKVLVNPIENFLDFATQDKGFRKALLESVGDLWEDLVPRYISDPGSVAPPSMKAMAEWQSNYSFFKNTKVSPDLIGTFPRSAKHQFYDYTTETSKMIGKHLNLPPAKLDNLVQNLTGGLGKEMLEAIDRGLFLFGAIEERPHVMKREGGFVRKIPFLSQFFVDYAIPANNLDFELLREARTRAGDRITENYRIASRIFEQIKENKKFEDRILDIEKGKVSKEIIDIVERMSKNNILNIGRFETFLVDLPVKERAWFIAQKLQEIEDIQMQKAYLVSLSSSTGKILTKEVMVELNKILPPLKNGN